MPSTDRPRRLAITDIERITRFRRAGYGGNVSDALWKCGVTDTVLSADRWEAAGGHPQRQMMRTVAALRSLMAKAVDCYGGLDVLVCSAGDPDLRHSRGHHRGRLAGGPRHQPVRDLSGPLLRVGDPAATSNTASGARAEDRQVVRESGPVPAALNSSNRSHRPPASLDHPRSPRSSRSWQGAALPMSPARPTSSTAGWPPAREASS